MEPKSHRIGDCPAFKQGACPFAVETIHKQEEAHLSALIHLCPAFESGCPFKKAETAQELQEALQRVPASHGEEGTSARLALTQILGAAHQTHADKCPVFKEECPFKKVAGIDWQGWWQVFTQEDKENLKSSTSFKKQKNDDSRALSTLLKRGTERVHAEAEDVDFVKALLERRAPILAYVKLVARLARVYEVMEEAMDAAERERGRNFFADQLRRTPSLRLDLAFYDTLGLKDDGISPATDAYVKRIEELKEQQQDDLLTAHVYTRYLGDLSGGQILKRAVKRGLLGFKPTENDQENDEGLLFYKFDNIGGPVQVKKFKDAYRTHLDAMQVADIDAVVNEAVAAFRHNTAVLAELDAHLGQQPHKQMRTASKDDKPTCPFLAGIDISKLPPDARNHHHHHQKIQQQEKIKTKSSGCPFALFGKRDCIVVGILAAGFVALPYFLA